MTADLVTIEQVKPMLGLQLDDSAEDGVLQRLIASASQAVTDYCQRRFDTVTETRYFSAGSGRHISPFSERLGGGAPQWVEVDDLLAVTVLQTDLDGDGVYESTWTAGTDYYLWPLNAPRQLAPYTRIYRNPTRGRYVFSAMPQGVLVTGTWGAWTSPPGPVAEAVIRTVERMYKLKDAPLGVVQGPMNAMGGTSMMRVTLDEDVRGWLERYQRAWVMV